MTSLRRPYHLTVCALLLTLFVVTGILATPLLRSASALASSTGQLQQQISAGQSRISGLSGALGAASDRLSAVNGSIAALEGRIARVQADLDAKRAQLLQLRTALAAARTRLVQLERYQLRAERVLSQQLVSAYENDRPDLVSVVLEARGFTDLLERLSFAGRVRRQSVQIVSSVRAARRAVVAQATRLGMLSQRQQLLTNQVLLQRDALGRDRLALAGQQLAAAQDRSAKAGQLASARGQVDDLRRQLATLQAAQAAQAAAAAAAAAAPSSAGSSSGSSGGAAVGPSTTPASAPNSGGGFTFPLPKSAASPPGTWSLDQGVDISAPGDTPEYAVCSGTIVLHGIGGFGPSAPVLHCDSPLGGYSYVYYGHAGPANQLPVGTHVSAGQVMSEIGPGIVGISTGPHLEIGFADSSGSPIGAGSASTMMSLLQGSY
jgi:murein DD-endopeptidase MepM/ murein hydrolase activator NlpD